MHMSEIFSASPMALRASRCKPLGADTVMFAADDVPHLIEQFWFVRGRHSHYPLRHESDFALPKPKLKLD